jgi:hypothetical protein
MDASRDATWTRIMAVQEQYNRLEETFAKIPANRVGWWLRWRFRRSVHAMVEVRGAYAHGGLVAESERRLPNLEHSARVYSCKFAELQALEERHAHG